MIRMLNSLTKNFKLYVTKQQAIQNTFKALYSQNEKQVSEQQIRIILKTRFPNAKTINVEDMSGGCGAMFNISIESSDFKGLSVMKQHRAVYDVLKDQIKSIHGLHLETKVP